jgi:hypothetical protein
MILAVCANPLEINNPMAEDLGVNLGRWFAKSKRGAVTAIPTYSRLLGVSW